ncbi:MAG: hypothetical protein RR528_05400 [Angelakisella sp.]
MKKIENIANDVLKITESDIEEVRATISEQESYCHPMKMATARWQHELAVHNKAVLDAILNLKAVIEAGRSIKKPI